ncbi:MAG: hypothetical protein H6867_02765 [Rhodospirillales bacterium]|nr:hypothetical protein [Rhodospirillales bacterium]MCB9997111.1 hypothetical protein [Rhodospirillales bacterium]
MRVFLIAGFMMVVLTCAPAYAQDDLFPVIPVAPAPITEVTPDPQCFNVINKAPYTVFGTISTDYFVRDDGIKARHQSNFRLKNEAYAEFCTTGPYYEGGKIDLTLRSLVPLFSCKTAVTGDIVIHGRRKAEGGTETWADCL